MRRRVIAAVAAAIVATALVTPVLPPATAPAANAISTPVIGKRIIGHRVRGRPIVAYHLGDPHSRRTGLILGQMHGDELAGIKVIRALIHGTRAVDGLNLWVIPTMNPDGAAAGTRQNAHHVDLNRNWPHRWARLTGQYYSGSGPLSEPETRAMRRFLLATVPHFVVSLHQPLHGVDTTDGGRLDPAFRDRLAANLHLPTKAFTCWSACHGNMTGWYTARRLGVAITVEFGWHPSTWYLQHRAAHGIVTAMGGRFGSS